MENFRERLKGSAEIEPFTFISDDNINVWCNPTVQVQKVYTDIYPKDNQMVYTYELPKYFLRGYYPSDRKLLTKNTDNQITIDIPNVYYLLIPISDMNKYTYDIKDANPVHVGATDLPKVIDIPPNHVLFVIDDSREYDYIATTYQDNYLTLDIYEDFLTGYYTIDLSVLNAESIEIEYSGNKVSPTLTTQDTGEIIIPNHFSLNCNRNTNKIREQTNLSLKADILPIIKINQSFPVKILFDIKHDSKEVQKLYYEVDI